MEAENDGRVRCPRCGAEYQPQTAAAVCPACALREAASSPAPEEQTGRLSLEDIPVPASSGSAGNEGAAQPTKTVQVTVAREEKPGNRIGRYKLLERIGEGGCGVVYVAEQEQPVRRRVALKVIKLGMDTRQVIARFEAERQALALMDHPNISKVLDAGATETGRPFFVMELVKGVRITDYCDRNNLSTAERLALFIQVCHAIQHAHQKGIIHRDIKPSNILVTLHDGVPVPKVIDFGIAKATTDQRLTDKTLYTAIEQFIGTPAYMSPEQAELSGLDVDTRSDIYALGVLLYELLTGRTPFDAKRLVEAGLDEIRRIIREEEPPRPSTRISTLDAAQQTAVAKHRHVEPPKLLGLIRGDLDWIVMKCLEKDRMRRYETANGLAGDVQRHLNNEPVMARPPSRAYRWHKAVRRNKLTFLAGLAIMTSLVIGIIASSWQAVRATRAERATSAALQELRKTAPAFVEQARTLASQERYDEAVEKLDYAAHLRPDVADYVVDKANLLECQLRFQEAAEVYRTALRIAPNHARANANLILCERMLAANPDNTKLSRESLAELLAAMQAEQRPSAELLPAARLLGEEKNLLLDTWLARLKDLPITPDRPLRERLRFREDGQAELDLKGTAVADLTLLRDLTLGVLNLQETRVASLEPLRGSALARALREIRLYGTPIHDVSPLHDCVQLTLLDLGNTEVSDLAPLRGLRLKSLYIGFTAVNELAPLRGMPLETIFIDGCPGITNVQLLGEFKTLKEVLLPTWARNFESLRTLPRLSRISFPSRQGSGPDKTAEEFWAEWDEQKGRLK